MPVVVQQGREPPADAEVEPHLGVGAVGEVHVVPLVRRHHFQRELIVVSEKERPLTVVGNRRRLRHDIDDGDPILEPEPHENPRHQREVKRHVAFVAVAEIGADIGRPLVGFGQNHPVGVLGVHLAPDRLDQRVGLRQVLAIRPVALDEVGDRVESKAVHAHVQPEMHDLHDFLDDARIIVVQVRLVREESMPVVGLRDRVPRPVRFLGVGEDDPGVAVLLVGVAPHVELALG